MAKKSSGKLSELLTKIQRQKSAKKRNYSLISVKNWLIKHSSFSFQYSHPQKKQQAKFRTDGRETALVSYHKSNKNMKSKNL